MAIIIWLAIGAAIGAVAGLVLHDLPPRRRLVYILLGMAGAAGGGLAAERDRGPWDSTALIVAGLGALILIALVNLFRRGPAG